MTTIIDQASGEGWHLWNGDCVAVVKALPDASVHYSVYSPPFISLYTFSDDPRDMSNCRTDDQFWTHYKFLVQEIYRTLKPGRLTSIHCMNLPTSKLRDGFIGLRDFRGDIIKLHQEVGFHFHSEVVIRKDPVSAMQRTKAIGLLHKQIKKDSSLSRMAVPDYVITMRKPGDNPEPISGEFDAYYGDETAPDGMLDSRTWDEAQQKMVPCTVTPGEPGYSVAVWQRYAEPVWMDIAQGDVLSRKEAREEQDEAHIAPLQLTVIRRCLELWSNPGDVVLTPFAGIGSEMYVALQMDRKAIGAELKPSYWRQGVQNCERVTATEADKIAAAVAAPYRVTKPSNPTPRDPDTFDMFSEAS